MEITKEQFKSYEAVRTSGVTNMFDVEVVCELSGLNRDTVLDIMRNYSKYKERYGCRYDGE